jgi:hypothetical protein
MNDHALDDDDILRLLGDALDATDPVPADAVAAANAANLVHLDDELAELVFDSLVDERTIGLRDDPGGDVRSLTFAAGDYTIELDLTEADLVGQVTPAEAAALELVQPAGRRPLETDEWGRFHTPVAPGPLRLRLTGAAGWTATPWITR